MRAEDIGNYIRLDGMSCSEPSLNGRDINNEPGEQRYSKNYTIE